MNANNPQNPGDAWQVRFWSKVVKSDGCWLWTGAVSKCGYGNVCIAGRYRLPHRVSYELEYGPIPAGLYIDHVCHSLDESCTKGDACMHRRCVNPAHLEAVTPRVNKSRARLPSKDGTVRATKRDERPHLPISVVRDIAARFPGENPIAVVRRALLLLADTADES